MALPVAVVTGFAFATIIFNIVEKIAKISQNIGDRIDKSSDFANVSLTSYTRPLRITSRVYIEETIANEAIVTDIIKTIHTQYAAFILAALQLNQFVSSTKTVRDILRVVATEDNNIHESIVDELFADPNTYGALEEHDPNRVSDHIKRSWTEKDRAEDTAHRQAERDADKARREKELEDAKKEREEREARRQTERDEDKARREKERAEDKAEREKNKPLINRQPITGKVVSFSGDDHIPAGKVIEVTFASPNNPEAKVTLSLLVQLSPFIVPAEIAVKFITKDVIPTFFQRLIQWKTGEIAFWRDFVALTDIVEHREKLKKLDPSGALSDMMAKQNHGRFNVMANDSRDKADRARNLASSVVIFSNETVQRAKLESGIDFTDMSARQKYFATSFVMIAVVVDPLYDQATFYYNGIDESATYSFSQIKLSSGGNNLDVISIMNALNQGKSPKF